ncbi:MAG: hypothetical protein GX139_09290 [Armatimonadetes bacterium]|nr:hypothetical protein [Armatimonadota bacterium]
MNCRQARELMGAYLYGDLAPEQMREVRVHAKDCRACRADLLSRGRVVSSLNDATPTLSDMDRQRIAWSVKGAVNRQQVRKRPLIIRLAPTAALAFAVLTTGFFAGKMTSRPPQHAPEADKRPVQATARIKITEVSSEQEKTVEAADKVIDLMRTIGQPAAIPGPSRETAPGRGQQQTRHNILSSQDVFEMREPLAILESAAEPKESDTELQKTEMEADAESVKLPEIHNPKNAETTPPEDQ